MGSKSLRPRPSARALGTLAALAAAMALGAFATGTAARRAHAARTLSLKESANLRLHDHHGVVLKEQGIAKGTLSGPLYLQLRVVSTRSVTAQVQVYPGGGSLSGSASAAYHVVGSYARFSGTMNITGGGGRYSKAHGYGMSFSGTIQRSNDAVSVYVSGRLSY